MIDITEMSMSDIQLGSWRTGSRFVQFNLYLLKLFLKDSFHMSTKNEQSASEITL